MIAIKSTVTEDERFKCATIEVGDKFKVLVIDLVEEGKKIMEHRRSNRMSNFVTIRATQAKFDRAYSYSHSFDKDDKTGIHYGILAGTYDDGNPKWYKVNLNESETFDLERQSDRDKFLVMRMSGQVKDSPLCNGKYRYEIVDQELVSKNTVDKSKEMILALERINKVGIEDAIRLSRFLGIPVDLKSNETEIRANIINIAIADPFGFNQKWSSPSRKYEEVLTTGEALQVIKHNPATGYYFHNTIIGNSKYAALDYFRKNLDIVTAIEAEIGERDNAVNKFKEEALADVSKKEEDVSDVPKEIEEIKKPIPFNNLGKK
jgi:hypothetical protein